eukprot:CAMPEP_0206510130 /NCGR_PEP_ID=MMETSP0324_2-20121206/59422_1 /ASSEMBLY_ACC=CAM_ASM_000836 /TAXON_ID=2866 /ORGANISM="Crypthecodinium cohnii, Strain Seligo" /LENGTH=71 /DNA_ID=CAMNT_0054001481 /DNA_START=38 /DNA_END=249 /DNA_ORIENTATION=-
MTIVAVHVEKTDTQPLTNLRPATLVICDISFRFDARALSPFWKIGSVHIKQILVLHLVVVALQSVGVGYKA